MWCILALALSTNNVPGLRTGLWVVQQKKVTCKENIVFNTSKRSLIIIGQGRFGIICFMAKNGAEVLIFLSISVSLLT